MSSFLVGDVHLSPRRIDEYRWEIFRWLKMQAERRQVERAIFLGDLCDRKDEHRSAFVNRLIDELLGLDLEIWWLIGNHDYIDPTTPFFRFMDGIENVHVVWEPSEADFDGESHLLLPHTEHPDAEWADIDLTAYDYILMHQSVHGAVASNGQKMRGLRMQRFDGVRGKIISGDIHVPQQIGPVTYVGSPHPVHMGDSYQPRIIWNRGRGRLQDIERHHLKKVHLRIRHVDELPAEIERHNLEAPDHVRVTLEVLPGIHDSVSTVRREIRTKLLKAGLVVHGVEIDVVQPPDRAQRRRLSLQKRPEPTKRVSPADELAEYVDALHGAAEDSWKAYGTAIALQLNDRVAKRNPGDITLDSVTLQGFRSFTAKKRLNFWNRRPGLYLITGDNRVDEGMTTNAVGKSTTFGGICWCYFDKDPRKLVGTDLHNWERIEPCIVETRFKKRATSYTLRRGHDPNHLMWLDHEGNETVATNEDVQDLLGTTYEHFLCTVLQGQFGVMFFDLTEGQQQKTLAAALQLDIWTDAAKQARAEATELYDQSLKLRDRIQESTGRIREAKQRLVQIKNDLERAGTIARAREAELKAERAELMKRLRKYKRAIEGHDATIKKLQAQQNEVDTDRNGWEQAVRHQRLAASDARSRMVEIRNDLEHAEKDLEVLHDTVCDRCKQQITPQVKKRLSSAVGKVVEELEKKLTEVHLVHEAAETALAEAQESVDTLRKSSDDLGRAVAREARHRMRTEEERRNLDRDLQRVDEELEATAEMHETLQNSLTATQKRLSRMRRDRRVLRSERKDVETRREIAKSWDATFQDVRLWLLDRATWEFEVEVNNAIQALGLGGWEVRLLTEREGTRGKTLRGLQIEIRSPRSVGWVKWKAWCGGETQRLKIAGALGLARLIENRTGVRWNVEFWDEPTEHLDGSGFADLLGYFRRRAREEQRQIWIADHHSIGLSGFDGHIVVQKNRRGTRFRAKTYLTDGE